MTINKTEIEGIMIIEPTVHCDKRGWFMETYKKNSFFSIEINIDFIQDNHSFSREVGVLRGIHFQNAPMEQTKLVRCTKGRILDVAVDLRKSSSTYKRWISVELSEDNKKQLFIPKGFGHAFLTLCENVEVEYKVDQYYSSLLDRSIAYNDPELSIDWPNIEIILSEKDFEAPLLCDSDVNFL